jgi:hypothetical protein
MRGTLATLQLLQEEQGSAGHHLDGLSRHNRSRGDVSWLRRHARVAHGQHLERGLHSQSRERE